jgi:hypothetical protein
MYVRQVAERVCRAKIGGKSGAKSKMGLKYAAV